MLETARDAGLSVEQASDIGPAIAEFRTELRTKREQLGELEHEVEVNEGLTDDHTNSISGHRDRLEEFQAEKDRLLDEAGVSDIDAYREHVERREAIEADLGPTRQSLIDAFGEPEGDDDPVDYWRTELDGMVENVDLEDIDPSDYDEDRHAELEDRVAELEDRAEELRDALDDHHHRMDQFAEQVGGLDASAFLDQSIQLRARSVDGLDQLVDDLENLADRIDRDAEISRNALGIFDDLHREEESQIAELFAPGGRASAVFAEITDDRYERVEYDPNDLTLVVHRDNGTQHVADDLSQGTRDQLYLATRISLAEQLLETEPGFFLMDDAFLPADRNRLDAGFEVLEQLVQEGWQIIYLTAKEEVGIEIVDEFGLRCSELEPLP